ncbi:MAG: FecR domain-containing protein [Deltaproteobacteria bacterium]|nr:FecR domain-containing protein [Deltaproteobacteria bacterium]
MNLNDDKRTMCPTSAQWLQWLSDREDGDIFERRPALQDHLDACADCKAAVGEVRRFQSMLLRGKAPALSPEQRQSLEERIRLQSGTWSPPSRVPAWLLWGTAVSAAAAIALLVAQPLGDRRGEPTFAESVKAATVPTADNPGPGVPVRAVEGTVELAGADGVWRVLQGDGALKTGYKVRAAMGGRLVAAGRFEFALQPGSEFETLAMGPATAFVRVRRGEVECQVEKLRSGQRFAVMFGAFRASVVGTRFAVRQDPAGAGGRVVVSEGAVRVDAADDPAAPNAETMTMVRAGHRWQYAAGVMSLEPIPASEAAQASEPAVAAPAQVQTAGPADDNAAHAAKGAPRVTVRPHASAQPEPPLVQVHEGPVLGPRQIVIEVPHQTMPPQDNVPAADGGARGPHK